MNKKVFYVHILHIYELRRVDGTGLAEGHEEAGRRQLDQGTASF